MSSPDRLLSGEVAIVTGGTQGIGRAIGAELVAQGASVAVAGRDAERAQAVAAEIGDHCFGIGLDVTDRQSVDAAVEDVVSSIGEPSILINNAGVNRIGPAESYSEDDWAAVLDVNLTGVLRCCQAVGSRMLERGQGTIINITSIIGTNLGIAGRAAYGASKGGVTGLTQVLSVEWAPRGVRVLAVAPGPVRTPMVEEAMAKGLVSEQAILDRTPLGRIAAPEDIARAVALVAARGAEFVTGQTIVVDGGYTTTGAGSPTARTPEA
jgi:NAD(P)-dependent dehydrogenase (short-subunit alcohol dehydrogenase family)